MHSFQHLDLKTLRKICSKYNLHVKIAKYSKLSKEQLIPHMEKHLHINEQGKIKMREGAYDNVNSELNKMVEELHAKLKAVKEKIKKPKGKKERPIIKLDELEEKKLKETSAMAKKRAEFVQRIEKLKGHYDNAIINDFNDKIKNYAPIDIIELQLEGFEEDLKKKSKPHKASPKKNEEFEKAKMKKKEILEKMEKHKEEHIKKIVDEVSKMVKDKVHINQDVMDYLKQKIRQYHLTNKHGYYYTELEFFREFIGLEDPYGNKKIELHKEPEEKEKPKAPPPKKARKKASPKMTQEEKDFEEYVKEHKILYNKVHDKFKAMKPYLEKIEIPARPGQPQNMYDEIHDRHLFHTGNTSKYTIADSISALKYVDKKLDELKPKPPSMPPPAHLKKGLNLGVKLPKKTFEMAKAEKEALMPKIDMIQQEIHRLEKMIHMDEKQNAKEHHKLEEEIHDRRDIFEKEEDEKQHKAYKQHMEREVIKALENLSYFTDDNYAMWKKEKKEDKERYIKDIIKYKYQEYIKHYPSIFNYYKKYLKQHNIDEALEDNIYESGKEQFMKNYNIDLDKVRDEAIKKNGKKHLK